MSRKPVLIRRISRSLAWPRLAFVLVISVFLAGATDQAGASEPTPQLPNLVADAPNDASFEVSSTEGGLKGEGELKLLLRFNGYIHNIGPGALEFRGSRKTSSEPMHAFQRIYYSDGSFKEEPSSAELVYVTADGHNHWHLQKVAKYSLWNSAKTAKVAPAQKVGFCLEDTEHVEPNVGPAEAVYSDANVRFCEEDHPDALSLFEGVSAGWRDVYGSNLAFQWVDASNVLPGEYWLRADVNPTGVIKEAAGANTPAYATKPTIVPGFDALAQATSTHAGEPRTLTLTSEAWNDSSSPRYAIIAQPQHGTLSAVNKNQITYTPTSGYAGPDSFSFSAVDPNSPFPRRPAVATVSIEVIAGVPAVTEVSPHHGAVAGGTTVMITGTEFIGVMAVKFGSTSATSFNVNSATSITAVSPVESAGRVDVTVTTPGGSSVVSSADRFRFTPTITKLTPNGGTTAGGTSVTVTGTGFVNGATIIKFGSAKATSVSCTSWDRTKPTVETTCTVVSPPHAAGKVDVKATVSKVSSPKTTADQYTYS